jgi:hypothetical protein
VVAALLAVGGVVLSAASGYVSRRVIVRGWVIVLFGAVLVTVVLGLIYVALLIRRIYGSGEPRSASHRHAMLLARLDALESELAPELVGIDTPAKYGAASWFNDIVTEAKGESEVRGVQEIDELGPATVHEAGYTTSDLEHAGVTNADLRRLIRQLRAMLEHEP